MADEVTNLSTKNEGDASASNQTTIIGNQTTLLANQTTQLANQTTMKASDTALSNFIRNYEIVPLCNNSKQTISSSAATVTFIADDTRGAQGLTQIDDTKVDKIFLIFSGVAVNTYAGSNEINCATATHNQWQINLDGGSWSDLVNGSIADGQMNDGDWPCENQGASHSFIFVFDVTSLITNVDGNIGLRLENGRSDQDSMEITISTALLKVVWKP